MCERRERVRERERESMRHKGNSLKENKDPKIGENSHRLPCAKELNKNMLPVK